MPVSSMVAALQDHAKYPMPESIAQEIAALGDRYGLTTLKPLNNPLKPLKPGSAEAPDFSSDLSSDLSPLMLKVADEPLAELLQRHEQVGPLLGDSTLTHYLCH